MSRILKAVAVLLVLSGGLFTSAAAASSHPLKIKTMSSNANWVTGGDALVAVDVASPVTPSKVVIRHTGQAITNSFHVDSENPRRLLG